MEIDDALAYFMTHRGATSEYKDDWESFVIKVEGKMFGLICEYKDGIYITNVKCDPELAIELREMYEGVVPAYHMNKKHWNTLFLKSDIPDNEIKRQIDMSYQLVVNGLPKKIREQYM